MEPERYLSARFAEQHAADVARVLERQPPAGAARVLAEFRLEVATDVVRHLEAGVAAGVLVAMPASHAHKVVRGLPIDALAGMLRRIPDSQREVLLSELPPGRRVLLARLLSYSEQTLGALADPNVSALPFDQTVGEAREWLERSETDVSRFLYVVDRNQRLLGAVSVPELMRAKSDATLHSTMRSPLTVLEGDAPVATLSGHPGWRDLDALPVVDARGMLLGVIRHRTIRQRAEAGGAGGSPAVGALIGLSEMYWAGLRGFLGGLESSLVARSAATEASPGEAS